MTFPITSLRGQEMLRYLPGYYEASRIMRAVLQAQGAELDRLRGALDEILDQFYIDTATWGLDIWEQMLAMPPSADETLEERRDRIKSKIRGYGTATIQTIKKVAESYDKGIVDVAEDYSAMRVIIRFVDTTGVPSNIEDLKAILRELVPAHLAIDFEYNYFTWDELDSKAWTWDELDALGITWDQLEIYQ
jgi:Uncharacterized protein conserved in bacteria